MKIMKFHIHQKSFNVPQLTPQRHGGSFPFPTSQPYQSPQPCQSPQPNQQSRGLWNVQPDVQTHIALLIGCEYTEYERRGTMPRLPGCHTDIHLAKKMLMEHYGYDSKDFIIVSDESPNFIQPTHANIVQQLKNLQKLACKNIVIYYSGHGTQIKDTSGDETDGQDECIVPCDYLENGLVPDDTLFEILSAFPLQTRVTCIFDSCNSGSIFDLPYRYEPPKKLVRDNSTPPKPFPLVVSISGCRDSQTSASGNRIEKNIEWEGAMSFSLREVLKKYNYGPVDVNVLVDEMRSILKSKKFSQIPQLTVSQDVSLNLINSLF